MTSSIKRKCLSSYHNRNLLVFFSVFGAIENQTGTSKKRRNGTGFSCTSNFSHVLNMDVSTNVPVFSRTYRTLFTDNLRANLRLMLYI
jgi:hypothetical protein